MSITIHIANEATLTSWDNYVHNHPDATVYHLSGWKNVIEKTYHHKTYYLCATKASAQSTIQNSKLKTKNFRNSASEIFGILPLVHLKNFIFGNHLISIPFFDTGGILADTEFVKEALLKEAIALARKLKADTIELRHTKPTIQNSKLKIQNCSFSVLSHKVRMLLPLPDSAQELMASFKSKLRSQIRKPLKEGLSAKVGRTELLDDFYQVFAVNMRDLGSPVHSKTLIRNTIGQFPEQGRIVVVYKSQKPLAASVIVGFGDTLANPWASSLREFARLSPNMLLYWTMLEYACNQGYRFFDFGRSTVGEGTYRFKKQWGAEANPLHWLYISMGKKTVAGGQSEKGKFVKLIDYWKKMPIPATTILGPMIRKNIGL